MNLYEKWEQLSTDESNPQQLQAFWKTYYAQEQAAYEKILAEKTFSLKGTAQPLMDAYAIEPEVFEMCIRDRAGICWAMATRGATSPCAAA